MKKTDSMYAVQKIISHRENQSGRFQYKIKWKGYPQSQSTWEPLSHLTQIQQMVKQYYMENQVKKISEAVWPIPKKKQKKQKKSKKEKKEKKNKKYKPSQKQKNEGHQLKMENQMNLPKQTQIQKFPKLHKLLHMNKQKSQTNSRQAKKLAQKKIKNVINQQRPNKLKKIKKAQKNKQSWRQVDNCVVLYSSYDQAQISQSNIKDISNKLNIDSQEENIAQNDNQKKYPSTSIDNKVQQNGNQFSQDSNDSESSSSSSSSSSEDSQNQSKVKKKITIKRSISYYPHQKPPSISFQKLKEGNIFKDQIKKIQNIRKQDGQWKVYVIWKNSRLQNRWINRNLVRLIKPKLLLKFYHNLHQNGDRKSIKKIRQNEIITNQKNQKKWIF